MAIEPEKLLPCGHLKSYTIDKLRICDTCIDNLHDPVRDRIIEQIAYLEEEMADHRAECSMTILRFLWNVLDKERRKARKDKDFVLSDKIRKEMMDIAEQRYPKLENDEWKSTGPSPIGEAGFTVQDDYIDKED